MPSWKLGCATAALNTRSLLFFKQQATIYEQMCMGQYSYITNRILENKDGKEAGRLRVLVKTGSTDAEIDYVCPECSHAAHIVLPWKRPFSVRCGKCLIVMKASRLKTVK